MDSGSSAPAPDYKGSAEATAQGNLDNLKYQTVANRPTINTPWGTQSWSNTPQVDQAGYDKALAAYQAGNQQGTWVPGTDASYGPGADAAVVPGTAGHWDGATSSGTAAPNIKDYTTDGWQENINLTPATQAALDAQQQVQLNQSQLAGSMQQQVADRMQSGFTAPSMSDYMGGVGSVNQNFGGFSPYGVGGTDQSQINFNSRGTQPVGQNSGAYTGQAGGVNLNTPQFSDANAQAGANAAYGASTGLLQDGWAQDTKNLDSQLRLQGLMPGTEAYNTAAQNLSRTQAQQQNALANQAVVTGNNMADQNYASQLAGYTSNLGAQGQAYGQGLSSFGADNTARTQSLTNALSQYQAKLQGQSAYNTAQGQAYNQSLAGFGANQTAIQNQNAAQQQAYAQAMGNYGTAYQSAYANYNQPLNAMNAILNGNQVQNPNFGQYSQAGYVGGPDYTTASQNLGQYASGQSAANAASNNATTGALAGLAGAAMIAF